MTSYRSYIDRYFDRRYATDVMKKPTEDLCLLMHSNGVCVLTLAPSHPIIHSRPGVTIKAVDYKVTEKLDRLDNKVSGKSKRGAQNLAPDSPVCRIVCNGEQGETVYLIRACAKGRLIEVNERLINEPQLLVTHPETRGYICVVVQKRGWQQRDGQSDDGDGVPQSSNNKSISLIDRLTYMRLRFPEVSEAGAAGAMKETGVVEDMDDN